jgi:hypothetical protein
MSNLSQDERGVFHLPAGFLLIVLGLLAVGTLGILRDWRKMTELQLRIDQCVSLAAQDLRKSLDSIEKNNERIKVLRRTLEIAKLHPVSRAAVLGALSAVSLEQEALLIRWNAKRLLWPKIDGCSDRASELPSMYRIWIHDPPDRLGPRPLRWNSDFEKSFFIRIEHFPRNSSAEVSLRAGENHGRWKACWKFGTNVD